jgi:predicted house-cleaning noncanonical NTP pyrophosphatase (MazG superfamily)
MAHEKAFYLKDGKVFSTLEKFSKELQSMTKDVFEHHVNSNKNDFKEWMKNSLNEEKLAQKVDKKIKKVEMELEVLRHLVHEKNTSTTKKESAAKTAKKAPTAKASKKKTTKKATSSQ